MKSVSVVNEVVDFLISQPTMEQILAFQPSEAAQERVRYLLDANRNRTLTAEEQHEMDNISLYGHLVEEVKLRIREKMAEEVPQSL